MADSSTIFYGGYAPVIQPTEYPAPPASPRRRPDPARPPSPSRPGDPAGPAEPAPAADADTYIYQDGSDPAAASSTRARTEDDAAYWYDLVAEDPVPEDHKTRGPFEPLVSSSGPPAASEPASGTRPAPEPAADESTGARERARARNLEQVRDLHLTAEAVGEQNLDRHFNQLPAQQRQLISEYFDESGAALSAVASNGQAEPRQAPGQAEERQPGGDVTPPEGLAVWAEPPRTW